MPALKPGFVQQLKIRLQKIYKDRYSPEILAGLENIISKYQPSDAKNERWSEKDVVLITYADSVKSEKAKPFKTLKYLLGHYFDGEISIVHILPFFPYSSDDGFSVTNFRKVNPELGNWTDIESLAENFDLMFDLVINHVSAKSEWFQNFLRQSGKGKKFFIEEEPATGLSEVIRPRSTPLLTAFETANGTKHIWTTFSADQVDLNFANPEVFVEMADILLNYLSKGARIIRLDAIAFLWKKPGTSCLHLPETHEIVKLLRDISEYVNPAVIILTETNVPNKENLSYFGNGDEAHMVYQFSLPPLLLHALHTGNSSHLNNWAKSLPELPEECTFFNFTASHDGIGLRPLEGLISEDENNMLAENMQIFGGLVNYKSNPDGTQSPYELNITYFDALKGTAKGEDGFQVERFLASQIIMMEFKGIPAFYIHSLTATPNYPEGVAVTGQNRTINRRKWDLNELDILLQKDTPQKKIFNALKKQIAIRKKQKAFHPNAHQEIIDLGNKLFAMIRTSTDEKQTILCITNVTSERQKIVLPAKFNSFEIDLIEDKKINIQMMEPYQSLWLASGVAVSNRDSKIGS